MYVQAVFFFVCVEDSISNSGVESGVPFYLKVVRLAGHMGSIPIIPTKTTG